MKGGDLIRAGPEIFKLEDTTIWSFPERGNWATHSGKYRGNWSPYIPRNIILRYSKKKDWILDQFLGSGTTLIEAKLLGRNAIGVDINSESVKLSNTNRNLPIDFPPILIFSRNFRCQMPNPYVLPLFLPLPA